MTRSTRHTRRYAPEGRSRAPSGERQLVQLVPTSLSRGSRHLRGAFRIWRAENTVPIRLAIDPSDAGWVSERRWHASQKTRRRADGGCELELTVDWSIEIKRFILQLGAAAQVLEPDWLRREIAADHAAAAQRGRRSARQESLTLDDSTVRDTGGR